MLKLNILLLCLSLSHEGNADIIQVKNDRFNNLESVVESLVRRLDENVNVITALTQKVEHLESQAVENAKASSTQLNHLLDKIDTLEETIHKQENRSTELEYYVYNLEGNVDSQSNSEHTSVDQNDQNGKPKQNLKQGIRRHLTDNRIQRRQGVEDPVAFFATLQAHPTHLGVHQTVVFERVVTNIGNAYSPHGGIFIAPVSGIYVFSASLLSHTGHNIHLSYLLNGVVVSRMYVGGAGTTANYDTSSQTIVLQLAKGDDVSVVNNDSDEIIAGNNYTTFSGFLLSETYPTVPVIG